MSPTARSAASPAERRPTSLRERILGLFAVDLRSLALLRIALGICVLADLADRSRNLTLLFTDAGAYPADVMFGIKGRIALLSLHYWTGRDPGLQAAVFVATALAALALIAGWRSWFANLLCTYLVASLQLRNSFTYIGGDLILRLLLFWGLWLPLGARFSLDARRGRARPRADRWRSGASAALLLQVAMMYWVTGLGKSGELWWSGQAVAYALRGEQFATPFGVWMLRWPRLLEAISWSTLAIELLGPFLAFVPIWNARFRIAAVALFWGFHLGLASCMNIGLFPLFSMAGWLAFLPGEIWPARSASSVAADPAPGRASRLASAAALVLIAFFGLVTAQQFEVPVPLPRPLAALAELLPFRNGWGMFAPDPPRMAMDNHLLIRMQSGKQLRRPGSDSLRSRLFMWRMTGLSERPEHDAYVAAAREGIVRYHCRMWNRAGGRRPAVAIALERNWRGLEPGSGIPERFVYPEQRCEEPSAAPAAR